MVDISIPTACTILAKEKTTYVLIRNIYIKMFIINGLGQKFRSGNTLIKIKKVSVANLIPMRPFFAVQASSSKDIISWVPCRVLLNPFFGLLIQSKSFAYY